MPKYKVTVLEQNVLYYYIDSDLDPTKLQEALNAGEVEFPDDYDDSKCLEHYVEEVESDA